MVYLIVAIALIFLTVKGFCGKKTSTCVTRTSDAFRFNILRMLLCMMIGIVVDTGYLFFAAGFAVGAAAPDPDPA